MVDFNRLKKELKDLKSSKELSDYMSSHKGAYFSSVFIIGAPEELESAPWNIGFFFKDNSRLTVFFFKDKWNVTEEDKVLQKEKKDLELLDLEKVKFTSDEAMKEVNQKISSDFPGDSVFKVIVILNTIDKKLFWNITVFTRAFKVINFKIDAVNGNTVETKVENLLQLDKK